jgi:serine/threonine protein kinase
MIAMSNLERAHQGTAANSPEPRRRGTLAAAETQPLGLPHEVTTSPEPPASAAAEAPAPDQLATGSRIGQYELIRPLGRGGMGEVYLARDLRLGRLVAIKLLLEHSASVTERFLTEARATARCNHENIVVIHDVGEHGGRPYMVLEHVEGQTLSAWWSERTRRDDEPAREHTERAPLAPSLAVKLMIPVVRALAYAHGMGIVHRDLKPANIMLASSGTIKVLDFGIATLRRESGDAEPERAASTGAMPGAIIGTLPYMSPEQLEGEEVDHRSDIWAVGIMLFEMVTGAHPTMSGGAGALPGALLDAVDLDIPMPSVSERLSNIGPLGDIVDRCLLKNRDHRTSSAQVLLQELEGLVHGRRTLTIAANGEGESPFAGLAAFQESDGDRFFGRDRDIAALAARLRDQPLVAVAGPSGAGKSSLVRAGVIPALKRSGEGWDAFVVRPGRQPLAALADVLLRLSQQATLRRSGELAREPVTRAALLEQLRQAPGQLGAELRAWALSKRRRVALFVDQLEELYTLGTDPGEVATFIACLDGVADHASSPLRVILSVRSDFLDGVAEHRAFMREVSRGLWFLPPLDRDGLREALVRPVEALDHRYEDADMVESMLDVVVATPGALPLLQFAASKLWMLRDRERRLLTRDSYEAMGGIAGTLASHAETVLAAMTSARLARARAVLERLVTPERTRAIAAMAELRELPGDADEIEQVVHHLVDARLLVIEGEGEERTIELVHESLIHGWPTLARWLDENRDDAAFLARLRAAAGQWENSGRDEGMLWRGEPAREAHTWHARQRGQLGRRELAYLEAVRALATRTVRRRRQTVAGIIAVLCVLLVAATTALVWIQSAEASAREQADLARANARIVEEQNATLVAKESELRSALERQQQARSQAEQAQREAEGAQREAEGAQREAEEARQRAEAEATRANDALAQASRSRDEAVAAAEEARAAEARAREAENEARAMQKQAEAAAEKERRAREELEQLIRRTQGILDEEL